MPPSLSCLVCSHSAISVPEIAALARRGRLQFNMPVETGLADFRKLPEFLITLVTADEKLRGSKMVKTLW